MGNNSVSSEPPRVFCVGHAVLIVVLLTTTGAFASPPLELRASAVKAVYGPNADVRFRFVLKNVSKTALIVNRTFFPDHYVFLIVRGPDDKVLPPRRVQTSIEWRTEFFVVLRPNESVRADVPVRCRQDSAFCYNFTVRGKYQVRAQYHIGDPDERLRKVDAQAEIWKGTITASPFQFAVRGTH
jgi:hypothetical protein